MERVTGIGGIFFKSDDPKKLYQWYEKHLGIKADPQYGKMFEWQEKDGKPGGTVWSIFSRDTKYFDPSRAPFMVNYRVDDLDALLEALRGRSLGRPQARRLRLRPLCLDHGSRGQSH
jgi:hypothetical protein